MEWIVIMLQHPRSQADLAATVLLGLAADECTCVGMGLTCPQH